MNKDSCIYIAGHTGMVGSAIERKLRCKGFNNIVTASSHETDLRNSDEVNHFFSTHKPSYVFLAAAKVGGIQANCERPAEFFRDNVLIQTHAIHSAFTHGVKKLLFFGSSCIYPNNLTEPISEEKFMSAKLEKTNAAYATAKIAGIEMCKAYRKQYGCNFISCMPCNLYGPNDNYNENDSHVMAALIRKIFDAKKNNKDSVTVWGTGKPLREFLHADDLAEAALFLMDNYDEEEIINVGYGKDISIAELTTLIAEILGYTGEFIFDEQKPDGTFRKLLDISVITRMGWKPAIGLREGIEAICRALPPFDRY